jgi:hypothetical protein
MALIYVSLVYAIYTNKILLHKINFNEYKSLTNNLNFM